VATAESCGKVKVSHAAVKSFDRRGVSCKNARTVQFSVGVEKCPVTHYLGNKVMRWSQVVSVAVFNPTVNKSLYKRMESLSSQGALD